MILLNIFFQFYNSSDKGIDKLKSICRKLRYNRYRQRYSKKPFFLDAIIKYKDPSFSCFRFLIVAKLLIINHCPTKTKTIHSNEAKHCLVEYYDRPRLLLSILFQGSYPIWLNADIVSGPINATTVPVDAAQFLSGASEFNNSVLSIGWTTEFGANLTGSYTASQISSMTTAITQNNVTQNITFPVRAGLAAESLSEITSLLTNVTGSTLTIWSSEGDNVNVTNLRNLIAEVGVTRVFIDVPDTLSSQLLLHDLPTTNSTTTSAPGNGTTSAPSNTTIAANTTTSSPPTTPGGANSLMPKLAIGLLVTFLALICT